MKLLIFIGLFLGCLIITIILEILYAQKGKVPPYINPSHVLQTFGNSSTNLHYLVMGDSTAAGQGADYEKGIAVQTAKYLAKDHYVTFLNVAVSSAVTKDVLDNQLKILDTYTPDIVLIAIGANDVIHMTKSENIHFDITQIISKIINKNCSAKIILTGAPDMGSIPRFLPPLSWVVSWESNRVNTVFISIANEQKLSYAPIFDEAGPIFLHDKTLYSSDNFHPNNRGYEVWIHILTHAIEKALSDQPSHCSTNKQ